jgi:hypothetical protein
MDRDREWSGREIPLLCDSRNELAERLRMPRPLCLASALFGKLDSSINEIFSAGEVRGDQLLI